MRAPTIASAVGAPRESGHQHHVIGQIGDKKCYPVYKPPGAVRVGMSGPLRGSGAAHDGISNGIIPSHSLSNQNPPYIPATPFSGHIMRHIDN